MLTADALVRREYLDAAAPAAKHDAVGLAQHNFFDRLLPSESRAHHASQSTPLQTPHGTGSRISALTRGTRSMAMRLRMPELTGAPASSRTALGVEHIAAPAPPFAVFWLFFSGVGAVVVSDLSIVEAAPPFSRFNPHKNSCAALPHSSTTQIFAVFEPPVGLKYHIVPKCALLGGW